MSNLVVRTLLTGALVGVSICAVGQQGGTSDVVLSIQTATRTTSGYDITVKIENVGKQAVSLALSHVNQPIFQSLGIEQWDNKLGWQSVGPCLDVPPSATRRLEVGESVQDIVPIGDWSHGWISTVCRRGVEHLGGKIRAALCVFGSDEHFQNRTRTPCKMVRSPTFQLPEPLHLAHFEEGPIKLVRPTYPEAAKKQGIHGTVVLDITVGEDGNVTDIAVLRGPDPLVGAAVEAVWQWQYRPHVLNGKPVAVTSKVTVEFVLPSSSSNSKDRRKLLDR